MRSSGLRPLLVPMEKLLRVYSATRAKLMPDLLQLCQNHGVLLRR